MMQQQEGHEEKDYQATFSAFLASPDFQEYLERAAHEFEAGRPAWIEIHQDGTCSFATLESDRQIWGRTCMPVSLIRMNEGDDLATVARAYQSQLQELLAIAKEAPSLFEDALQQFREALNTRSDDWLTGDTSEIEPIVYGEFNSARSVLTLLCLHGAHLTWFDLASGGIDTPSRLIGEVRSPTGPALRFYAETEEDAGRIVEEMF